MQPVAKLIRQIRAALAAGGSHAPVESLAAEYARLCQDASQRLESCAAMLEKGSEYQALQLAETDPVLLDLMAALSFAEAPDWAAYCAANQLAAPLKFDARAVQALDRIYAKGISANHPLYRDYRAAVTSRDDGRAMHIIRSIVRLNPDDANAQAELTRLENKLFQLQLHELRAALTPGDEPAILAALAELERLATPTRLAEIPEYARACELRRGAARREAIPVAERLVEALDEEHQAGAWRMVGDLLARLRALQAEHGFSLPEKSAAQCAETQRYCDAQRAAAEETARFEQALGTLDGLAAGFETRRHARPALSFGEAQRLHGEFQRGWEEVEKFQRPRPAEFGERMRATTAAMHAELHRLQRQRRLRIAGAGTALLAGMAAVAWFTLAALRAQEYAAQLTALRDAGQVEAAEKMIAEVRHAHTGLTARPRLAARLDEVDRWTRDGRAQLAGVESRLTDLETTTQAGLAEADPMAVAAKLAAAAQLTEILAAGLRAAPAGRLVAVQNQFDAHVAVLREKLTAQADGELTALENLAAAKLGYDQPSAVLAQTLAELEPTLKSLEARVKPPVAALELPAAQQTRVAALRRRAELFREELDALAKVREAVLQTTTLETYLQALAGYKTSRLAQSPEVNGARKLLAALPKPDDLLASLLLPGDPAAWAAARAEATADTFAPDTVLPAEIGRLVALRDDAYLNDIWEVTFTDFRRKSERRDLYARGEVKKEGPNQAGEDQVTRWMGTIYDPGVKAETVVFIPTTYTLQRSHFGTGGDGEVSAKRLSSTSECLARLELNRMTDAAGTTFERPLLRVFEELVRDKSAPPLFKAYLMQQLGAALKVRPYAWGLEFCASLRDDLAELDRLLDGAPLRSQDWLLERKRAQLGPKLTAFFRGLENRGYLAEARVHREVVRGVVKAGLQFGGFIDAAGQAHLLGEARAAKPLWALAADGPRLARYVPPDGARTGARPPVAEFSPVFFVPLDRTALLAEVGRKAGAPVKLPAIPWLETP